MFRINSKTRQTCTAVAAFVLAFCFYATTSAQAATFNIGDGDVAGLIAAIQTANTNGEANVINLAPKGTYILTTVADTGYPDYQASSAAGLPFVRSTLTLNGNGATIQRSTASGIPDFVILQVSGFTPAAQNSCQSGCVNATLILNGVTLMGGSLGGLDLDYATAIVQDSTVTQNSDGGINNICSNLTLLNSTVSYNTSTSGFGGGGIFLWQFSCPSPSSPSANISFSTIYENGNPGFGRGNAIGTNNPNHNVFVKNSILASPSRANESVCNTDAIVSLGHNVGGDASCALALTGVGDINNTNPFLGPTVDNGGPTPTDLPAANSPAINAVPLAYCSDVFGTPVPFDQRGVPRPQGSACDIGSVEVVLYNICLLYDPAKPVQSGSTDPIKLEVCDGAGNDLSSSSIALHAVSITQISTSLSAAVQASGNANPDNDFRFDPTLGQTGGYIFNLSTKGLPVGTYTINFAVGDNALLYAAQFQVK